MPESLDHSPQIIADAQSNQPLEAPKAVRRPKRVRLLLDPITELTDEELKVSILNVAVLIVQPTAQVCPRTICCVSDVSETRGTIEKSGEGKRESYTRPLMEYTSGL